MKKQPLIISFALALLLPALALAAQQQVSLGNDSISPSTIDVNAGDTVVWTNASSVSQSVTGDDGLFQSGSIAPGAQFAATFNQTGTYNYYDDAQGGAILGEVVVGGTSVTTPTTTNVPEEYVNPNSSYEPVANSSDSTELASLESELQSLIAEIDSLEGNSSASVSGAAAYSSEGSCPQIGRVLSLGSSGSDVSSLQEFLAASVGYTGGATGYYGTLTQTAVEQYQTENDIISYGTPATTGYGVVGPRTAAAIRLSCSGGSSSPTAGGSGVVSGFLQVAPVAGTAPLTVTVTATVNTADDCDGATYDLDFGDGTADEQIPVAAGDCSQGSQQFQHTYEYGGSYTITLSANGHSSTATVTVAGPSAPGTAIGSGSSQATGSINALVSSGNAPFSTTFYVSCASGLAYDVVFGDGTDLGGSGVSESSCNGNLQSVAHTYQSPGSYTAELVVFTQNSNGTVSPESIASQSISVSAVAPAATTYQPPTLTPDYGGNPLAVSLQYNYDSSGCEVSINWGDGQTTGPSGCTTFTGQMQTYTQTHTYAQAGNYTITLDRASQTDTVGVSIAN